MGYKTATREFVPATRTVNGLFILFDTKETVYVEEMHTGTKVVFHRWFDKDPGFYTECWKKFVQYLKLNNSVNLYKIYVTSAQYGVAHMLTDHIPDIPEGAKVIPERRKSAKD